MLRSWGGIVDMTMDGSPIIDRTPVDGLFFNGGWCYGGFKATPASGWCFAHLIATGERHAAAGAAGDGAFRRRAGAGRGGDGCPAQPALSRPAQSGVVAAPTAAPPAAPAAVPRTGPPRTVPTAAPPSPPVAARVAALSPQAPSARARRGTRQR